MEKLIVKLQKGGDIIGFSFCNDNYYSVDSYFNLFKDKNTNYKF